MKQFVSIFIMFFGVLSLTVWQCEQCFAQQTSRGDVIVLTSYHPGFVWTSSVMDGIQSCFDSSGYDIKLTIEYMDTKRYTPEEIFDDLFVIYQKKYCNKKYDAVIAVDNNALNFLLKYSGQLFQEVPIVFTGINNFEDSIISGHDDITGVAEAIDIKGTIDLALDLFPATKDVAVIRDVTPTDNADMRLLNKCKPDFEDRVRFVDLAGLSESQLINSLKMLPKETVVLFFNLSRNSEGVVKTIREGNNFITQKSGLPMFTLWDHKIVDGVLGGVVINGHFQGQLAADIVLQIIEGVSVKQIPVIKISPNVPMFNYDQLVRFGINTSNLPEGSIVLNKPDSYFQKYKVYIVGITIFLGLQTLVIIMLWVNIVARRKAENILNKSEQKFRDLVESTSDWIWEVDIEGKFVYASPKVEDILGYKPEELIGKTAFDLMELDEAKRVMVIYEEIVKNSMPMIEMENINRHKDGHIVVMESSGVPVFDDDGSLTGYRGIDRDVTLRKQSEWSLKKNESELKAIYENAPLIMLLINRQRDIIKLNEKVFKFSDKSIDEAVGLSSGEILNCIYASESNKGCGFSRNCHNCGIKKAMDLSFESGQTIINQDACLEYKCQDNSYSKAYVKVSTTPLNGFDEDVVLVCLEDVTERRQAEEMLKNYNSNLEAEVQARTEELVEKNAALEKQVEERKKAESELKTATAQLVQSEKLATIGQLAAGVAHEINNPLGAIGSSNGIIFNSFEKFIYDFENSSTILNSDKALIRDVINVILDSKFNFSSRENRQHKQELTKAFDENDIPNPSFAASVFVGIGLVKDYQKYMPLLICEHSSELLNYLQNVNSIVHGTRIIDTAINQSSRVVNALKDFARSDEYVEIVKADIRETLDTAMVLYGNMIKHGIIFKLDFEEVPPINCYPHKLCQVWSNLIQNAVQAMGQKGILTISLKQVDNNVQVSVSDTGTGITTEIMDKIFDPLFSTKAIGEGTGLGLDIAKRIVERHHGKIEVDSVVGQGTTFNVSLPIS